MRRATSPTQSAKRGYTRKILRMGGTVRLLWALGLVVLMGMSPVPHVGGEASAAKPSDKPWARQFAPTNSVSLNDAVRMVKRRYGGRVVAATPARKGGVKGFQIRTVTEDGRVKTIFVDHRGKIEGE